MKNFWVTTLSVLSLLLTLSVFWYYEKRLSKQDRDIAILLRLNVIANEDLENQNKIMLTVIQSLTDHIRSDTIEMDAPKKERLNYL